MIVPPLSAHAHIGGFAHVVHRQISAAAPSSSEAGDGAVISAEDLIHTADEHWNVSGASVIAAWLLTVVVGVSGLLLRLCCSPALTPDRDRYGVLDGTGQRPVAAVLLSPGGVAEGQGEEVAEQNWAVRADRPRRERQDTSSG